MATKKNKTELLLVKYFFYNAEKDRTKSYVFNIELLEGAASASLYLFRHMTEQGYAISSREVLVQKSDGSLKTLYLSNISA